MQLLQLRLVTRRLVKKVVYETAWWASSSPKETSQACRNRLGYLLLIDSDDRDVYPKAFILKQSFHIV